MHGRVLDVGCGVQPYRELLGPNVDEYVGVDIPGPLSQPTVVGRADHLPFEPRSFDAVISTQVLEHLPRPIDAARGEAARVLRPSGQLVLTVPGVWPTHESPHDYWRFTRFGLHQLFDDAGLELRTLEPLGGLWAAVGQLINLELQRRPVAREMVPCVNLVARWLDRRGAVEDLALAWLAIGTLRA